MTGKPTSRSAARAVMLISMSMATIFLLFTPSDKIRLIPGDQADHSGTVDFESLTAAVVGLIEESD